MNKTGPSGGHQMGARALAHRELKRWHGWLGIGFVVLGAAADRAVRTLWIAALVSNVGTWMQTVGAQWLVVCDAHAADETGDQQMRGTPRYLGGPGLPRPRSGQGVRVGRLARRSRC